MAVVFVMMAALMHCASARLFRQGEEAVQGRDLDMAVEYYRRALEGNPDNVRYRFALSNALISASNIHLKRANELYDESQFKLALMEYQKALDFNAENTDARRRKQQLLKKLDDEQKKQKTELEQLKEKVSRRIEQEKGESLEAAEAKVDYVLPEMELKQFLQLLQKQYPIRILLEPKFQSKKILPVFQGVTLKQLLDYLMIQTDNFYKVIDPRTILIIADNPGNRKKYDELVMRTFFLSNADPKTMVEYLKQLAGIKSAVFDPDRNTLTVRDTPERVQLAEKVVRIHDRARPEVVVDVEVIEVNKNRMKEYGIELSQYQVTEAFNPGPLPGEDGASSSSFFRGNTFRYVNSSDFIFSLPSVAYKLLREDVKSNIKARPHMRAVDQETVKIHVGDKVPIPTTTFVPNYGVPGTNTYNSNPITSFTMQDVGIKIELMPRIHHNSWITLQMKFELTFITSPGTTSLPPTIGTRSLETVIQLRDNETGLLAGLLRDSERNSLKGLPGISEIPILKEILSSNKKNIDQTDIILTITPRITKFPDIEESDLDLYWVGTEENPGLRSQPPIEDLTPLAVNGSGEKPGESDVSGKSDKSGETVTSGRQVMPDQPEKSDKSDTSGNPIKSGQSKQSEVSDTSTPSAPPEIAISVSGFPGEVSVGEEFSLAFTARGKPDLKMAEMELAFDPEILEVKGVEKGGYFRVHDPAAHLFKTFDNGAGRARISISSARSGGGETKELVVVVFRARKAGGTEIRAVSAQWLDARQKNLEPVFEPVPVRVREQ